MKTIIVRYGCAGTGVTLRMCRYWCYVTDVTKMSEPYYIGAMWKKSFYTVGDVKPVGWVSGVKQIS